MCDSPLGLRQTAWKFAVCKHNGQRYKDTDLPFLLHIGMVLLETLSALENEPRLDAEFAVCCAILHDVIEHTDTNLKEVERLFGTAIAAGVLALSKNDALSEEAELPDSLTRIRREPREIWLIKLADRISGMETPPASWNREKRLSYTNDARSILDALGEASPFLAAKLASRIAAWQAVGGYPAHVPPQNSQRL